MKSYDFIYNLPLLNGKRFSVKKSDILHLEEGDDNTCLLITAHNRQYCVE